ncbi:MAG: oxidative damage protection protein [Acidobacteriota bacterium]
MKLTSAPGGESVWGNPQDKLLSGGQRIYDNVSQEAWALWLDRLRMLINEYRLAPATKESQEIIAQQMEQFFFGEGAAQPPGYVPPQK